MRRRDRTDFAALLVSLALCASGLVSAQPTSEQAEAETALQAVRQEIASLGRRVDRETRRRDAGLAELKRLELAIAAAGAALADIDAESARQRERGAALDVEERLAETRLAAERSALAQQVRMSYMAGRQELFKLMLSQESPADLGRMLTYYDYLNRARGARIAGVAEELARLARLADESRTVRQELERLRQDRTQELEALSRTRSEREQLIEMLDARIRDSGAQMERLALEEERLTALVAELAELLAGFPASSEAPFTELKGQLRWPIDGRIAARFGELREGGPLRWNGVLLEAEAGTTVRAVYHGRVAFSDWLPGLGLLLIVDHGDGYMSLYGHNAALLREPGDWVSPGEAIAEVGDTGGQARTSLYFAIRRNGEPQNPSDWMR